MKIAVTGHRPNKLYGYDLNNERYQKMKSWMKDFLKLKNCTVGISGMALGVDQVFALAILELREEGYPIALLCAIPCQNHSCKWPKQSQQLYENILSQADEIYLVTNSKYSPGVMQKRNEYMVDRADEILAIWDGSAGGTGNCVSYAENEGKKITINSPSDF